MTEKDNKKNLVLMVPQLRHGGAERVVSNLSYILKDYFNVIIVVFDDTVITYEYGSTMISLDIPSNPNNNLFIKLMNVIKRVMKYSELKKIYKIDITYSFGDTANLINILTKGKDEKVTSIRGFKRIIIGRNLKEKLFQRPISMAIAKLSDKVITVSNLISDTLINEYKLNSEKVFTVYNGYDTTSIQDKSKEQLTEEEEKIFEKPVIITAGTFRPEKGYWHLIKSFNEILKNNNDINLVILGKDYNDNLKDIRGLVKKLNIEKNVFFLGYKKNPYKYLCRSTVYALSSVFEGFPNALVEAMACGLPIVANDCTSGPREILAPNITLDADINTTFKAEYGILTPRLQKKPNYNPKEYSEKEEEFSTAIELILKDEKLRKYYQKQSLKRVKDFSFDAWKDYHNEVLLLNNETLSYSYID